ncbi:MAG: M23 family metallopeptidase [Candidatus Aminicenantes bacterium]|nr:M23 family metallopeptidase [Candidatus Aminicenantes bacterium]
MAKKHLSLIIVPHTKTSCRTLTFSQKALRALGAGSVILVLALTVVLVDYISMSSVRRKFSALSEETVEQKALIAGYERSIGELRETVANLESYAKKINIMAGLKSPDVLTAPAGLGGGPSEGELAAGGPALRGGPQAVSPLAIQNLSEKAESIERNLNSLVGYFESESLRLASTPSVLPAAGWLSSRFGHRTDPFTGTWTMHWGVDISTNVGNPIVSTADGIVIKVQYDKYLGNSVTISHGNGFTTVYGHMSKFAVKAGKKVKRGEVIGYIGKTGKAAGPHVHYEVWKDGKKVDPSNYILEE